VPIYEYRCRNGHRFEVFQYMADEPVATCEECDAPVERVFHPVAVHFKGSGFYTTDYAKKKAGSSASDGAPAAKDKDDSSKKPDSKDSTKSSSEAAKSSGSSSD